MRRHLTALSAFSSTLCSVEGRAAPSTVGVVGGGIAGVSAARTLAQAGLQVVLHEREAQLGGRLGKVDVAGYAVGTGCSYIKAKTPEFTRQLEEWSAAGLVAEWRDARPHLITAPATWAPLEGEEQWYVGCPHMGSPTELSEERDGIRVVRGDVFDVNYESSKWVVAVQPMAEDEIMSLEQESESASVPIDSYLHSALVVATPVSDAADILPRKLLDTALGRGRYKDFVKERVSVAVVFESPLDVPFAFGVLTEKGSPVTVAICDTSRRAAASGEDATGGEEVWVLQSDTGWARTALDEEMDSDAMGKALLASFAAAVGTPLPPVRACETVVWPYGDMDYELEGGCAWLDACQLALAGDWAFNGRVEGAWLSGRAAAQQLIAARGRVVELESKG